MAVLYNIEHAIWMNIFLCQHAVSHNLKDQQGEVQKIQMPASNMKSLSQSGSTCSPSRMTASGMCFTTV